MAERLFIIDGMSQIFRCYYAPFQPLTAPSGEPTRATYVFTQMLLQLDREQKPDYLAVAMDSSDETVFRKEFAPDYKAHRDAPPEDLAPQIERILSIVHALGIPILCVPGFEADDILATVCRRLCDTGGIEVNLVSKDKDLDQVLSDCVRMFDPGKAEFIGPAELRERKGYGPDKAVEVQILSGDTTDNVPGVKGVGPKKAAALIAKYGTAQAVVEHAQELTPAMRANVLAFADKLEVTRKLVTLRDDVPIEFELERCRWQGVNYNALYPIAAELGFNALIERIRGQVSDEVKSAATTAAGPGGAPAAQRPSAMGQRPSAVPPSRGRTGRRDVHVTASLFSELEERERQAAGEGLAGNGERAGATPESPPLPLSPSPPLPPVRGSYILVDSATRFADFLDRLKQQRSFAFDTETTHLNPAWARLAGLSFCWDADTGYYLPICGLGECLELEPTLAALRPIFADPHISKIGQNLKYDLVVLAHHGVLVRGVSFDTMIASFVLDSSRRSHGMDALARELLGRDTIPISDLIGTGRNQVTFESVETTRACEYAGEDADVTWQLWGVLGRQLEKSSLKQLFQETEMPLVEVLAAMEAEGVRLEPAVLKAMSGDLETRMQELARRIYGEVGHEFNLDSPRQLSVVLFDELKLPAGRMTKTGRSTDAATLEALAFQTGHPVPALIKEYRELAKLKGTYIDTLPQMISPRTGRVHASFHQTSAITGRLSSSDPNLQNIPIRTEIGRQIRRAFVPRDPEHVLLTADYSQIELRVLAHFCQDEALKQAFAEDRDIHQFVAAQVAGLPLDQVSKEQRSRAKAVNFGIIYGQSAYGLARTTGMSTTEAQTFIDRYFERYPGIREFIDRTISEAGRQGYVSTILGRRRAIPELHSRNRNLRQAGERLAVNTVIQGSAADLIKRAMINIHRRIVDEGRPSRLLIQVHDELVFDVERTAVEQEAELIRYEMTSALPLDVSLKVDIDWGDNWLEGK